MNIETILWIFAGLSWGVVALVLVTMITIRIIQKVVKKRGKHNNRLTVGFDHTASTAVEEREKGQ